MASHFKHSIIDGIPYCISTTSAEIHFEGTDQFSKYMFLRSKKHRENVARYAIDIHRIEGGKQEVPDMWNVKFCGKTYKICHLGEISGKEVKAARNIDVIANEIKAVEDQMRDNPDSPNLPNLQKRLSDLHIEMQQATNTEAERKSDDAMKKTITDATNPVGVSAVTPTTVVNPIQNPAPGVGIHVANLQEEKTDSEDGDMAKIDSDALAGILGAMEKIKKAADVSASQEMLDALNRIAASFPELKKEEKKDEKKEDKKEEKKPLPFEKKDDKAEKKEDKKPMPFEKKEDKPSEKKEDKPSDKKEEKPAPEKKEEKKPAPEKKDDKPAEKKESPKHEKGEAKEIEKAIKILEKVLEDEKKEGEMPEVSALEKLISDAKALVSKEMGDAGLDMGKPLDIMAPKGPEMGKPAVDTKDPHKEDIVKTGPAVPLPEKGMPGKPADKPLVDDLGLDAFEGVWNKPAEPKKVGPKVVKPVKVGPAVPAEKPLPVSEKPLPAMAFKINDRVWLKQGGEGYTIGDEPGRIVAIAGENEVVVDWGYDDIPTKENINDLERPLPEDNVDLFAETPETDATLFTDQPNQTAMTAEPVATPATAEQALAQASFADMLSKHSSSLEPSGTVYHVASGRKGMIVSIANDGRYNVKFGDKVATVWPFEITTYTK